MELKVMEHPDGGWMVAKRDTSWIQFGECFKTEAHAAAFLRGYRAAMEKYCPAVRNAARKARNAAATTTLPADDSDDGLVNLF